MKNILRRSCTLLVLAAALAVPAWGQYQKTEDEFAQFGGPGGGAQVREPSGALRTIKEGDKIRVKGSSVELTVGPDGLILPIGVSIMVNGVPATTLRPHESHSVSIYPLAVFSIGGRLRLNDNSLTGGTRSIAGSVYAYGFTENLRQNRRYELGGFYFLPYNRNDGDLYQVGGRYFFNPRLGAQVAYLDTTTGHGNTGASSVTYHVLIDLPSSGLVGSDAHQFSGRLGIGVLNNLSREYQVATNVYANRRTLNFSTFIDLSYGLTRRLSLSATEWFVRDRNADINRLGIGLSYRL